MEEEIYTLVINVRFDEESEWHTFRFERCYGSVEYNVSAYLNIIEKRCCKKIIDYTHSVE